MIDREKLIEVLNDSTIVQSCEGIGGIEIEVFALADKILALDNSGYMPYDSLKHFIKLWAQDSHVRLLESDIEHLCNMLFGRIEKPQPPECTTDCSSGLNCHDSKCPLHGRKVERLEYSHREDDPDIIDEYKYNIHRCMNAINKLNGVE